MKRRRRPESAIEDREVQRQEDHRQHGDDRHGLQRPDVPHAREEREQPPADAGQEQQRVAREHRAAQRERRSGDEHQAGDDDQQRQRARNGELLASERDQAEEDHRGHDAGVEDGAVRRGRERQAEEEHEHVRRTREAAECYRPRPAESAEIAHAEPHEIRQQHEP